MPSGDGGGSGSVGGAETDHVAGDGQEITGRTGCAAERDAGVTQPAAPVKVRVAVW